MTERNDTLFRRHEIFVAAATIAAHANCGEAGFRQRDVRFLIELFSNWVDISLQDGVLEVKNTQVQRFLEGLVADGSAKRVNRGTKQPVYRLSRLGLLDLLSRISNRPSGGRAEHFLFLHYFLCNYGPRIVELIRAEGRHFPTAMRLEIEALLDYRRLLEEEIRAVTREIRQLDERIDDAVRAGELATRLFAKGVPLDDVVLELEKKYPYELNNRKPLSELIGSVPADLGRWELTEGNLARPAQMWSPVRALFAAYLTALKKLADAPRGGR